MQTYLDSGSGPDGGIGGGLGGGVGGQPITGRTARPRLPHIGAVGGIGGGRMTPQAPTPTPLPAGGAPLELGDTSPIPPTEIPGTPAAPGAASGAGGTSGYATMTSFGPGADLQGTTIAPAESATLAGQNAAQAAAQSAYTGYQTPAWQGVAGGSYAPGHDTTGTRGMYEQALAKLANGPDRMALASDQLRLSNEINDQSFAGEQRQVGQNAAKFGRIGAGMTTNDLTGVEMSHDRDRNQNARQLSLDAAGQTMADRLAVAQGLGAGTTTLGGEDRANAGVDLSLRNEARGERDAQNAYGQQGFTNSRNVYGDLTSQQSAERAYEQSLRGELRGERDYQTGQSNTAFTQNLQAQGANDAHNSALFSQFMSAYGAGNAGNPTGAYQNAAAGANGSSQSALDAWYRFLAQYPGAAGSTTPTTATRP